MSGNEEKEPGTTEEKLMPDAEAPKDKKPKDQIAKVIGEVGPWQLEKLAIVFFICIPGLSHIFASAFIMPKTEFTCKRTESESTGNFTKNLCMDDCVEYEFDYDIWTSTMLIEFELICEKSGLPLVAKMLFFSGFGVGTFLAGLFSDHYGRKRALLFFSMLLLLSGVVTGFMPNFISFLIVWIVVGIAAVANFTVAFVWAMEVLSGKWKILLGMSMQFTWPTCRIFLLTVAWFIPNWRIIMQVITAPCVLAPVMIYFLPESIRWLVAKERLEDAKDVMMLAVKRNKIEGIERDSIELVKPEEVRKGSVLDIMRYPVLRKKTLIMYFNWFASSFMLYGLSLNWQHLTGGLFLNFLMASLLDFPGKAFAAVSLYWWGRKLPYLGLNLVAGTFYIIILFIPRGVYPNEMPIVILQLVCSFCVSSSFAMLWMWMSELMPTTVRNAGVGSASMIARLGGVFSTTIGTLATISPNIPIVMLGIAAIGCAISCAFLPETQGLKLPDTPEESEKLPLLTVKEVVKLRNLRPTGRSD